MVGFEFRLPCADGEVGILTHIEQGRNRGGKASAWNVPTRGFQNLVQIYRVTILHKKCKRNSFCQDYNTITLYSTL